MAKKVGVLALQGDFAEHVKSLESIGAEPTEVRLPDDLVDIDALIIPGGESTTIARLMDVFGLTKGIKGRVKEGMPVWGTCAGMIVLAKRLVEDRPQPLGLMDIRVQRNAYGRQIDSFETEISRTCVLGEKSFRAVFIRAPAIDEIGSAGGGHCLSGGRPSGSGPGGQCPCDSLPSGAHLRYQVPLLFSEHGRG